MLQSLFRNALNLNRSAITSATVSHRAAFSTTCLLRRSDDDDKINDPTKNEGQTGEETLIMPPKKAKIRARHLRFHEREESQRKKFETRITEEVRLGVNVDDMDTLNESGGKDSSGFQRFPNDETYEMEFGGVKFKELPIITAKFTQLESECYIEDPRDSKLLLRFSPEKLGFKEEEWPTNVAAQAIGLAVGQACRQRNLRNVRVRLDGFNAGRESLATGVKDAGINVVSVSDCTMISWHWPMRAKKRPRVN